MSLLDVNGAFRHAVILYLVLHNPIELLVQTSPPGCMPSSTRPVM